MTYTTENSRYIDIISDKLYSTIQYHDTTFQHIWNVKFLSFDFQVDPSEAKRDEGAPGPRDDDLEFWHKLIALITSVVEEDKTSYSPVLNQFPQELNIGHVRTTNVFMLQMVYDGHINLSIIRNHRYTEMKMIYISFRF